MNVNLEMNKNKMSSVIPVLSVLKHSDDEGLPTAPSLETKIPETSVEDPKVVSETIPSFKSKGKVKFKQKDNVYHKDTAADATPKNNKTKITQYFSASKWQLQHELKQMTNLQILLYNHCFFFFRHVVVDKACDMR